jgi:hypothetical protein
MVNNANDNSHYDISSGYSSELSEQLLAIMRATDKKIRQDMETTLLDMVCEEISAKLENLRKTAASYPHSSPVLKHVIDKLKNFICERGDQQEMDIRMIPYQLELVYKLEKMDWSDHSINIFPPVDEVLISMNYNSKTYIDMLQAWMAKRIEAPESPVEQLKLLNFYTKGFSQLLRKPDVILHQGYPTLIEVIERWFEHESKYLETEYDIKKKIDEIPPEDTQERIRWSLSSDQIALVIRAADDTRLIAAKSMNAVFKKLIPHISSLQKEVLSPTAVRSRAYNAEQTDKEVVIKLLKKMITHIEGY